MAEKVRPGPATPVRAIAHPADTRAKTRTEPTITPAAFAAKWKGVETTEKASSQSHFIDLLNYKDDLGNPPLLVVSDLEKLEIHTNFTGLSPVVKSTPSSRSGAAKPTAAQSRRNHAEPGTAMS